MRAPGTVACILAFGMVVACGADAPVRDGGWAGEIRERPDGSVHVRSPNAGAWGGRARWTVEETLRIGALDGDGPDVFGRISALEVDGAGRIHVFDAAARELRTFGPDGRFLGAFGRRGGGPGEFEGVIGVSVAPDGALWLVDAQNVRYTVIEDDDVVATHRRASPVYHLPWIGGFGADGDFFDAVALPGGGPEALLRVAADGAVLDTLAIAKPDLPVPGTRTMSFPLPYAPRVLRAFDRRGYVWTAVTHEYRLVRMTLAGDTVLVAERAYEAPGLTGEQQDSVRRHAQTLEAEFRVEVRPEMLPRAAPILRWFAVDDRGAVWVCRADVDACSTLDVFDPRGRFLGDVALPFGPLRAPPLFRGDDMFGVVDGEFDVPVVVRGRIRREVDP